MTGRIKIHESKAFASYEEAERWLVSRGFIQESTYVWRHKTNWTLDAWINVKVGHHVRVVTSGYERR